MEEIKRTPADAYSPLTLAFIGDGVYDLLVRDYLVRKANRPVGELNKVKVSLVNCESQAAFAKDLMPCLNEREQAVYKRGRNAAPKSTAKNGTIAEYHSATGLEKLSTSMRCKSSITGRWPCCGTASLTISLNPLKLPASITLRSTIAR